MSHITPFFLVKVILSLSLMFVSSGASTPTACVGETVCSTLATGVLNADTTSNFDSPGATAYSDPFSLEANTLYFGPAMYFAMPPVLFQACTPNFEGFFNVDTVVNGTYAGTFPTFHDHFLLYSVV
ncbi:hypothetical protein BS17DRAFT_773612 [Gyrodon lividus]|nr:hypothetical protein BS17DRAFT_773612 [Gyrodon lividus]